MRRLYQAVQAAEGLEHDLLFPSESTKRRLVNSPGFVPFTSSLNQEQIRSVEMILGCEGAPPFVIYGPPGTGKTMTLVEAMLQIYATRKNDRILVCAASNSAADHILEKLISNDVAEVRENQIFRLNASSRTYEDVHPDHIGFCYYDGSIFKCPHLRGLGAVQDHHFYVYEFIPTARRSRETVVVLAEMVVKASMREKKTIPSWFNRIEASKVVEIINKLRASADLDEADIGVITPYRQQVLKIKKVLENWELSEVKVGSVEQFQGQEREVIIVSTVRARSLLIIVGNPHIVSQDPYWEKLLWFCADNNSYKGCPLPERQSSAFEEPVPKGNSTGELENSCHSRVREWIQSLDEQVPQTTQIVADAAGGSGCRK
ncbi:hypothetical protein OIU84_006623 [Salix udensis]|uniref:RNA helicase n=1 Tax=Salix udensis TaxID=889485 RepID=A0AAD6JYT7_9ROSI|nr:hypothetical protein OIU84_006623 [Salix udensis]